jgi:Na+-transporting NADH:ubiquinone oxidoreductase subunit F
MMAILTAVLAIGAISLALTLMILLVDATIGDYGECELRINGGDKTLRVDGGRPLLATLNAEGIFIPSACGGRGSCGLCTIKVNAGAGDYLPTELPWIKEAQRKEGIRLSCQVKVRQDMDLYIPPEFFLVKQFATEVASIVDLTHDIKEVRLKLLDPPEMAFKAGQFVQIQVPPYELSEEEVYRAYSLSSAPSEKGMIEMQIRLVPNGICTTWVHRFLKVGDRVTVNGPHGDFHLRDTDREIVFIAGGSGMAPIKSMLLDMCEVRNPRRARYFFGAVRKRDLFHVETMRQLERDLPNFSFVPALSGAAPEDEWTGDTGLITAVLDRHIADGGNTEAYLCGSPGMIDAAVGVLRRKGVTDDRIFYDKFA